MIFHFNNGETQTQLLSDDETQVFCYFDNHGYFHLCQSRNGNRLIEVELAPSEAQKMFNFMKKDKYERIDAK